MKTLFKLFVGGVLCLSIGTCFLCQKASEISEKSKQRADAEQQEKMKDYESHETGTTITLQPYGTQKVALFKSPRHWGAFRDGMVLQQSGDSLAALDKFAAAELIRIDGGIKAEVLNSAPHYGELNEVDGSMWLSKIKILDGELKGKIFWIQNQEGKR